MSIVGKLCYKLGLVPWLMVSNSSYPFNKGSWMLRLKGLPKRILLQYIQV